MILSTGAEIGPEDFPLAVNLESAQEGSQGHLNWIDSAPETVNLRELLEQVEKGLIARALKSGGGVQAEAARRETLQLKKQEAREDYGASYFIDYVERFLDQRAGSRADSTERRVVTTMWSPGPS